MWNNAKVQPDMERCKSCYDRQENRGIEQMADYRSVSRLSWCNEAHSLTLTNEGGKGHVGLCDSGI